MLRDQLGAAGDQLVGAFLLGGLVIPGTGEGHVHGHSGADRLGAQIEAGVAGNHLGVGEGTYIAHLGFLSGELTGLDHLVQLQARSHTGQVTALVDGGEGVVVVAQALGVSLGAGGVAELNLGELLSGLNHVILVTEGVGEDDVAAGVSQLAGGVIALLALGDVGTENVLILSQAQGSAGFLSRIHEVQVVGGVLVVQEDEAQLHIGSSGGSLGSGSLSSRGLGGRSGSSGLCRGSGVAAAGSEAQHHDQNQSQRQNLFHVLIPPKYFCKSICCRKQQQWEAYKRHGNPKFTVCQHNRTAFQLFFGFSQKSVTFRPVFCR